MNDSNLTIAITGHTSGIGKSIHDYFINRQHAVIGFSKSSGYDIRNKEDRENIISQSQSCDVFVNNAFADSDDSQFILLCEMYQHWRGNKNKLIINISSRWTTELNEYCIAKKKQDQFCEANMFTYPKIVNIKPGLIDTPRVKNNHGNKLSTDALVEILDFILLNRAKFIVSSITFGHI